MLMHIFERYPTIKGITVIEISYGTAQFLGANERILWYLGIFQPREFYLVDKNR